MSSILLGNRYQLQEPIGRGLMAIVYRGIDSRTDHVVAIKVLREMYSSDPKFARRFQREAAVISSLQHPNIVQVYDSGQADGTYFTVMELVEGTDLRHYLRSRGILDAHSALIIAHAVARGLGAAHRRSIVHRATIPQHILLGRDGRVLLTDFSIASVFKMSHEEQDIEATSLNTVPCSPPEQAMGEIVTPAADVYSLGGTMYEMFTGHPPFDGDSPVAIAMQHIQERPKPPSQYNPTIPTVLEELIMRCLEKEPEMRFRDGSVLARSLAALLHA
jgi:eukaryotic-like serine/threonine-protein kinase